MQRIHYIWRLPRLHKRLISVVADSVLIFLALHLSMWSRLGDFNYLENSDYAMLSLFVVLITVATFTKLGLYRAVLRYLTFHALFVVTLGAILSAISLTLLAFYFQEQVPRTVPIIYGAFLALLCGSPRLIVRTLFATRNASKRKDVLIYGAGSAGRQLALALRNSDEYKVRAFVDDDRTLVNTMVLGLPVMAPKQMTKTIFKLDIELVFLAIPGSTRSRRSSVIESLSTLPVVVQTVPDMMDIVSGKAKIDELVEVSIDDLLGRDSVEPQLPLMQANTSGQVVMVTGAGGSIGSELCRQIIMQRPSTLILFELSEFGLYQIEREINGINDEYHLDVNVVPLLGSVQRFHRLHTVMEAFEVDTVYHAAAYKHVPLVEFNVIEGVRNNVFGTYYTAKAAIAANVKSFVLVSTDKAVRPTNIMGTTKRMAELCLQAFAEQYNQNHHNTRFCMVRFGNVLGSSGSVIPLFKKQIANGGPLTVTHPEITRYFMTIPEAAQLVIQAGAMGKGGDVFVLDMGKSVRITELAKNLIHLSGLQLKDESNPFGDIEITYTGLRPGEKLFEELLIGDNVDETAHPRIMTADEEFLSIDAYERLLDQLDAACHNMKHETIRQLLIEAPTAFQPTDGISDLVWKENVKIKPNNVVNFFKAEAS